MHRSGTSLLSGWLHRCGLNLGDRLMAGGHGNEKGHYEDLDFHDFHEAVFQDCGIPYGGFENLEQLEWGEYEREKLKALAAFKSRLHPQWGFKEPRSALFLPLYRELFPEALNLVVYRPYREVVDSLLRREWKAKLASVEKEGGGRAIRYRLRKGKYHREFLEKRTGCYLQAWITYNREILHHIDAIEGRYYLFPNHQLNTRGDSILAQLSEWGYRLTPVPVSDFFDESMMKTGGGEDLLLPSALQGEAETIQQQLAERVSG